MLFSIESANIIKPLIFLVQKSCIFKIKSYLCNAFNKSTSERKFWRGGRVVDCGGLENRCTARYPGFESLSLRWKELQNKENPCKLTIYGDFLFLVHSKNKHIKAFFRCTLLPSMLGTPIWLIIYCLSVFCILTCYSWRFSFVIKKQVRWKEQHFVYCSTFVGRN